MKRADAGSKFTGWALAVAVVLMYAFMQHLDNEQQASAAQHKAEIIKAAKEEFAEQEKARKWAGLMAESERLTSPIGSTQPLENAR